MNKKTLFLSMIFVAVLAIAIYCIPYLSAYRSARVSHIPYSGLSDAIKKHPKLKQKQYYYFSAWNIRCRPCIEEMPRMDSLADHLSSKIAFVYVSDDPDEKASAFLRKKGITSRNFTYLHDMGDFISTVYHAQGIKYKVFPTHFVTDSSGKILIFKTGGLSYGEFNKGHIMTKTDSIFLAKLQDPFVTFLKEIR